LSDSSSSVFELTARLKKSEQLNSELRSVEAKLKQTHTETSTDIVELKRDIEYFKRMFPSPTFRRYFSNLLFNSHTITARCSYASAALRVVILSVRPSVRPSVTRVLCD